MNVHHSLRDEGFSYDTMNSHYTAQTAQLSLRRQRSNMIRLNVLLSNGLETHFIMDVSLVSLFARPFSLRSRESWPGLFGKELIHSFHLSR